MKSSTTLAALVAHCRKLTRRQQAPDAELLRRFIDQRETAAFEEMLERYAPLVWGVCRRILSREADCEDAFQATFLSLVRQAGSLDPSRPLGAWLHTIAVRTAAKARVRFLRQPWQASIPEQATCGDIADELGNRELFRVVDEEIARLPALLREPFVLCCLEGRTRDEAAAALRCSVAAIKSRLERSRNILRHRLERRGFGLPAAFLVLGLTGGHVRASLRIKVLHCVFGSAPATVAALVPAAGVSLASKLTPTAISFVMVGVLGFGAFYIMEKESSKEAVAQAKDIAPKSYQPPVPDKPQPRVDRFGDPLPPGAIRRFGTLLFRHDYWIHDLAFTPDSKQLIAGMGSNPLAIFDVSTGRRLRTIDGSRGGNHYGFTVSPDGKRVVCCVMGTLWDLHTGKLIRELGDGSWQWSSAAFSPDGKIVAAAREFQAEIVLVETETGKQLAHQVFKPGRAWPPQYSLDSLAFSPDGKYVAAVFVEWNSKMNNGAWIIQGTSAQVWLLDAAKGTLVRTIGSAQDALHGIAFQPGTGRLAAVGKDDAIRFLDVNTGKEVHRIASERKAEERGILRFLAGGKQCAVSGTTRKKDGSPDAAFLTILDMKDGKELRRLQLGNSSWPMALSPDGRTVATAKFQGESCVRVWDVKSGTERLGDAGHRTPATLSLSADGRTLISRGGEGRVIHWDLQTGKGEVKDAAKMEEGPPSIVEMPPLRGPLTQIVKFIEISGESTLNGPRWRLIFHQKTSEMEVRSQDGSKLVRKVKWPSGAPWGAILSPDGTQLAVPIHDNKNNSALLWNPEREDEPHKLDGPPSSPPFGYHSLKLLFTHDSKRLLVGYGTHNPSPPNALWVWDVATARIVRKLPIKFAADHLILSSDDRLLITASSWEDPSVHVWELETGKHRIALTDPLLPPIEAGKYEMDRYIAGLHLSADDRFLAVVTNRGGSSGLSIWDTAAWKVVRSFPWTHLQNRPHSMIFSREGRSLFVANSDTTILEWDVAGRLANGRHQQAGKTLNRDRLNVFWQILAEDPDKAYPAVWELLDHPAESVPFLIDRLSPVKPADADRVWQLIARLDSESFAQREEAHRQLLTLGEPILAILHQALKDRPSLEKKKRIQGLIESLSLISNPNLLRLLRALAVLEWSSRPEAGEHIRRLAGGDPSATLTRAAKAAWQRLKR